MSVALFDLAQRLRAAALSRPIPRSAFAPVLPPTDPIAVTMTGAGDSALVLAANLANVTTATGPDALEALARLGVSLAGELRTLVIPDRSTLSHLVELARATDRGSACADAAAVVGWWDHPGSGAVLNVTVACSARWVLAVPPTRERQVELWRQSLGGADHGSRGLLEMAAAVSSGQTLPGLEAFVEDDQRSWEAFKTRLADPSSRWDWRTRDSRREAALGLATRCDAAELYESLRLGDPLVATRESFGGTLVTGVITAVQGRSLVELTLDHLACRLREQTEVEGFPGFPRDLPPAGSRAPLLHGRVTATRVTPDERLVIAIGDANVRPGPARAGQRLTLRPRSIDPRQQRSGRRELHRRSSLVAVGRGGANATAARRTDVPLDVVVAAAE